MDGCQLLGTNTLRHISAIGNLVEVGEMARDECLSTFSTPWWFAVSQGTQGVCWERREGYAGNLKIHYSPESRFVYVFDYST